MSPRQSSYAFAWKNSSIFQYIQVLFPVYFSTFKYNIIIKFLTCKTFKDRAYVYNDCKINDIVDLCNLLRYKPRVTFPTNALKCRDILYENILTSRDLKIYLL